MRWKVLAAILSLLVFPATIAAIVTLPEPPTPGETVYYFLTDLNEGDYYFSSPPTKYFSSEFSGKSEYLWYLRARRACAGKSQQVYILKEDVEGMRARVKVRVACSTGAVREDTYHLVSEDGVWKIDLRPWQRQIEAGLKEMEREKWAAFEERLRSSGRSREPENQKMPPRKKRTQKPAAEMAPEPE